MTDSLATRLRTFHTGLRRARKRAKFAWRRRADTPLLRAVRIAVCHALRIRNRLPYTIQNNTVWIRTGTPDIEVAYSCLTGEFDEALDQVTDPQGLFVDAGAYIGTAAIAFARRFPQARVVCLEPSPDNYSLAVLNTAAFPNIVVLETALDGQRGERILRARQTGDWGHTLVEQPADCPAPTNVSTVPTVQIDDLRRDFGYETIELLKLDIEGGEYAILTADTSWLARTNVLVAELHDRIVPGCTDAFMAANAGRTVREFAGREKIMSTP